MDMIIAVTFKKVRKVLMADKPIDEGFIKARQTKGKVKVHAYLPNKCHKD